MRRAWSIFAAVVVLTGCHRKELGKLTPPSPPTPTVVVGGTETGFASWYGHPYHGRPAADGEIYDMEQFVAAHRTLPFNTWVRVFDMDTGKSVDLRIIDRGPFVDGRVIDVSHAAAKAIDMIGPGTARVRVEVIRLPQVIEASLFAVQVGAFRDRNNAERLRQQMASRYGSAKLVRRPGNPDLWRVLVGSVTDQNQALGLAGQIRKESVEKTFPFVVRLDTV
jgi:rare lipoprotein A